MIPKTNDILKKFNDSVTDCKALFYHCLKPIDKHTDAGIEAAFLQLVKCWEAFLEDSTLILLCGELPLSGVAITPKFVLKNIEEVRLILYNGQAFTDWIKVGSLLPRFRMFFETNNNDDNRLTISIKHSQTTLDNMRIIRNEIAHSSFTTEQKIKKVYNAFNPVKVFNRPAEYLKELSKQLPTKQNFIFYAESIEFCAHKIIG